MSKHLTLTDRAIIEKYLAQDMSFSFIAKRLNRSATTISRELKNHRCFVNGFRYTSNDCINYRSCLRRNIAIRNQFTLVPIAAKHVRNSTVKAYVHSTFLHIVLCWINRLMFALVVQMRRHAKETMPTTLLIGRTLNTSKN